MKCVIYSNCQADGLALFLPKMGFPAEITVYRNYQMILGEQKFEDLEQDAKTADLFIYQPTSEEHKQFSSGNVMTLLPVTAETISFAYVYNHGMHPITEYGGKFPGSEFMNEGYWEMPLIQLLTLYDRGGVDFALWPRFLHCLAEQANRERDTDIKLTRWMSENLDRRLLLNVNHPTSLMFVEMGQQIMRLIDVHPKVVNGYNIPENLTNLPCTIPFAEYVRRTFHVNRDADHDADEYYRNLLTQLWQSKQTPK